MILFVSWGVEVNFFYYNATKLKGRTTTVTGGKNTQDRKKVQDHISASHHVFYPHMFMEKGWG